MKNTTISLDDLTIEQARKHAQKLGLSFSAWVNKLILDAIKRSPQRSMQEALRIADRSAGNSKGKRWTRDDIYER